MANMARVLRIPDIALLLRLGLLAKRSMPDLHITHIAESTRTAIDSYVDSQDLSRLIHSGSTALSQHLGILTRTVQLLAVERLLLRQNQPSTAPNLDDRPPG